MSNERRTGSDMTCIKVSMIAFNLSTLLAGSAILGIGVWLWQSHNDAENEVVSMESVRQEFSNSVEFYGISILLLGLGFLVTFISLLGVSGTFIHSRAILLCYLSSVTLVLVIQLVVVVFAIIYRQPMASSIRRDLLKYVKTQYRPKNSDGEFKMDLWDYIQEQFECCGVDGWRDLSDARKLPSSCCQNSTELACGDPNSVVNEQGCFTSVQAGILEQLHLLASLIITLVFFQLYGILAATLLFFHAKSLTVKKSQRTSPQPSLYKSYRMV